MPPATSESERSSGLVVAGLSGYFDACATAPPSIAVLQAMQNTMAQAWANPASLHAPGLAAAESLERSRLRLSQALGCTTEELLFCSGASEAIHHALIGSAACLPPGRLLISAVEHPATLAAAAAVARLGWQVECLPVDRSGLLCLDRLEQKLRPPTRMVSLIWGQSEVGSLQPIETIAALCRHRGVRLHVDAVQVLGHRPLQFQQLPIDLLSCGAHKLQGPRGIGALLVREGLPLQPLIGGGGQERGRRGGTEAVVLAAGFAAAVSEAQARLERWGMDPVRSLRDSLLAALLELRGIRLSGPDPRQGGDCRLPHHISLLLADGHGQPLAGRAVVRALARQGIAVSSGSACAGAHGSAASPVLLAMGFDSATAASGLRLSLGPWLSPPDLGPVPSALAAACAEVAASPAQP